MGSIKTGGAVAGGMQQQQQQQLGVSLLQSMSHRRQNLLLSIQHRRRFPTGRRLAPPLPGPLASPFSPGIITLSINLTNS